MTAAAHLTIRIARSSDSTRISELSSQLGYETSADQVDQAVGTRWLLVAEIGNEVVGWIQLQVQSSILAEDRGVITGMVVDKRHRRSGIGRGLVEETTRPARSEGLSTLRVRSRSDREDAHDFYRALGFRELKVQKILDFHIPEPADDANGT